MKSLPGQVVDLISLAIGPALNLFSDEIFIHRQMTVEKIVDEAMSGLSQGHDESRFGSQRPAGDFNRLPGPLHFDPIADQQAGQPFRHSRIVLGMQNVLGRTAASAGHTIATKGQVVAQDTLPVHGCRVGGSDGRREMVENAVTVCQEIPVRPA